MNVDAIKAHQYHYYSISESLSIHKVAKIDINLHGMKNSNGNLAYDTTYKHTIESSSAKQTETFVDAKNKVEFRRIVDDASGTFEVTLTDSKTKKLS